MDNAAKKNYDSSQTQVSSETQTQVTQQPEVQNIPLESKVPFSLFERIAIISCCVMTVLLMVGLVSSKIALADSQRTLQRVNAKVSQVKSNNTDLKQEIGTLNSSDRLQSFAKAHGLSFNEQAVRNVAK
ncbi:cell division protein FtsL [Agrilactobacillus fermenti]|uniref:cell division protein FtsL n=1 Tax=Agrilactobacillus fermenti TaxID=2586909 RepID=UPI001E619F2A|nr:cell division protein FtsL [Agrilactobacillus fermenti]MCD2255316.1 cell division protein FtsL [Agrilactobacillus fermenti]